MKAEAAEQRLGTKFGTIGQQSDAQEVFLPCEVDGVLQERASAQRGEKLLAAVPGRLAGGEHDRRDARRRRAHRTAGSVARAESMPPLRPRRTVTISARIASAVSSALAAPTSSPIGAWIRARSASPKPCVRSHAKRCSFVRRLPIAPT